MPPARPTRLSVEACRRLIPDAAHLSDYEVERLRDELYEFAHFLIVHGENDRSPANESKC